jgi:hypothetical protein
MRLASRAVLAAAVPMAVLVTACGSAGNGLSGTPTPASVAATAATTLAFTVTATGSVPADGTFPFKLGGVASCSVWVAPGRAFDLELTQEPEMVGDVGFELVVGVAAADYHGPGTYIIDHTAALQDFYLGSHEFSLHGATLQVKADGSGSISFSGEQDLLGNVDSGTISWSCA